ncbi:hypothetical protein G210_0526 [Candida maltosa Xu316]|uniref:Uncharacterized protein n=1 Tax=Candida maltosa (strain Xu316) TaxID=1245528 RepID=M3HMZ4_CANMX|nr:hypothetical protein G210_0526 [Candida maltosa Xu316]
MPDPTPYPLTNYYFLLRTENITPLIDSITDLTQQINKNHKIINDLCTTIDQASRYPTTISTTSPSVSFPEDVELSDPLHYLLEQKYNLPQRHNTDRNTVTDYKTGLCDDISRLEAILNGKQIKNGKLKEVLEMYEDDIVTVLIPNLKELIRVKINETFVMYREVIAMKFDELEKGVVYKGYLEYVDYIWENFEKLNRIVDGLDRQ